MNAYRDGVEESKKMALVVYILYACTYFTFGLTAIIGVIVAHIKKNESEEPYYDHFLWQINTFWFFVLSIFAFLFIWIVSLLSFLNYYVMFALVAIGAAAIFALLAWALYRIIKGFIRYREERSPYE